MRADQDAALGRPGPESMILTRMAAAAGWSSPRAASCGLM